MGGVRYKLIFGLVFFSFSVLNLSHSALLCMSKMDAAGSQRRLGLMKWNKQTEEIHFKEKAPSAASSQSCQVEIRRSSSWRRKPVQDVSLPHSSFHLSPSQHLLLLGQKKHQSWYSLRSRMGHHWGHRYLGWGQTWTKRHLQMLGSLRPSVTGP